MKCYTIYCKEMLLSVTNFLTEFFSLITEVYLIAEVNVSQQNPAAEMNAMKTIFCIPWKPYPI